MVDATAATFELRGDGPVSREAGRPAFSVTVSEASGEALALYARLAGDGAVFAPAQSPAWVSAWVRCTAPDALIAFTEADGRPVMGVALEVVRKGPFRVARLMGGSHANANFAPVRRGAAVDTVALVSAIACARPDIDLIEFDRMLPERGGIPNPLLALPSAPSPNPVLAVDLAGGFDALLARSGSGRKAKKHRAQTRKLEAAGGLGVVEADTPEEVARLLDAFLGMKAERFREAGIPDVFAPAQVRLFFRTLFTEALAPTPAPFILQGLEVGGRLRAVTGSSLLDGRMTCEFGAITDDELAHASPGDFLFYRTIEDACRRGLGVYDFGVGDEPYKRSWCDMELRLRDVAVPLGARGRVLAALLRLRKRAVEIVKGNPRLWTLAKSIRRRTAGGRPAPAADRSATAKSG